MGFFKIAAKNLGRVKSRTILTILAIGLGTALLTGIAILNDSYLDSYLNGVSEQLGYTDIGVKHYSNVSDGYFTIDDFIDDVKLDEFDGIIDYTGRIVDTHICTNFEIKSEADAYRTTFFGIDVKKDRGYGYAEILNWTDTVKNKLGKEPQTIEDVLKLDSSYCVITNWVKEVYNFQLGDTILIPNSNDNFDNSNTWESYEVAAIINDQAEGRNIKFDYSSGKISNYLQSRALYFDIAEIRKMLDIPDEKINLLYIHVDLDKLQDIGLTLQEQFSDEYFGANIKGEELSSVRDSVRSMQMILVIFTMISFIVSIMLTANTLFMSVSEQKYEVGILRAQGIYKKEIFKLFIFEGFLLSLTGTGLGVLMGLGLSPLLKMIFFTTMMSDSTFDLILTFNLISILTVFVITFLISLIIGILPAYIATKINIIEAIRNLAVSKKGGKIKKYMFPIIGLILTVVGYIVLWRSNRNLQMTLIGIIPFIIGLIILSTVLIPILSTGFSYLFSFLLGPFRKVTAQNLKRDPKQTKITFIMFGLAIGFLIMVSNVLNSIDVIQHNAVPRSLGADIRLYSEGSTYGMESLLMPARMINKSVANATLISSHRIKVDGYGKEYSDKEDEPRVNLYIIEGKKFEKTLNVIDMLETKGLTNKEVFKKLDTQKDSVIVTKQLADKNHLNKTIGDEIEVEVGDFKFKFDIIGITEFISGFSETWEKSTDIFPADKRGKYCIYVSWNSFKSFVYDYYSWMPELDILVKRDDQDNDFYDFPLFNRTEFRNKFAEFIGLHEEYAENVEIAERVWDEEKNAAVMNSSYVIANLTDSSNYVSVHLAFENTTLAGTTEFLAKRHDEFETIADALINGTDQCVITSDINATLNVTVDDKISIWYKNGTGPGDFTRKNLTIAGIIHMSSTIEAVNFHAQNPYIGEYDVGADDTTAVITNINTTSPNGERMLYEDFFNDSRVFEFWIKFKTVALYFDYHLHLITELQDHYGTDFVFADMRWLFTKDFAYAPIWLIQVAEGYSQDDTLERVKEYLLKNKMPVIGWQTVDELREKYSDQIDFQKSFFNIVLSFALIIAVLGIMINMLISISKRRREIGMMRAIGTHKKELLKMILGETLILIVSGFLIGTIMGSLSAYQLLLGLPLDTVFELALYIDYWTIAILLGIVLAVSIIASALPGYKVLKLDVIEALRAV
ncbi:MAG: ABC transporter permease [Promethearchaeota archaeon]